jgi:hypothetical protein
VWNLVSDIEGRTEAEKIPEYCVEDDTWVKRDEFIGFWAFATEKLRFPFFLDVTQFHILEGWKPHFECCLSHTIIAAKLLNEQAQNGLNYEYAYFK